MILNADYGKFVQIPQAIGPNEEHSELSGCRLRLNLPLPRVKNKLCLNSILEEELEGEITNNIKWWDRDRLHFNCSFAQIYAIRKLG